MKLNCDLGESFGPWKMGMDRDVIPHIDMANIACGFHAGDANVMANTLKQTFEYGTEIGAHPGYQDLAGFGRRNMQLKPEELINLLHYQIAALDGMARVHGQHLSYVKPHGALYNQMMAEETILKTVMLAVSCYQASIKRPIKLMLLATGQASRQHKLAEEFDIELYMEAFADRRYDAKGFLLSRNQPGAVLNREQILEQVRLLVNSNTLVTDSGDKIEIAADTLCVHGDNPESIELVKSIKEICSE